MTKPANFPERLRQRRLRALSRLTASGRLVDCKVARDEARRLTELTAGGSKRDVRTKKYRGPGREFQRAPTTA